MSALRDWRPSWRRWSALMSRGQDGGAAVQDGFAYRNRRRIPRSAGHDGEILRAGAGRGCERRSAIEEHYKPAGPNDRVPTDPVSIAVALADKIDTLVGFWAIDEKPTGSKDPYALRRAALGVIRLILENRLPLKLNEVLYRAILPIIGHLYYTRGASLSKFAKSMTWRSAWEVRISKATATKLQVL